MGSISTSVDLHIIPLGSYDVVLGMDWLELHGATINCRQKIIKCRDDWGKNLEIRGIQHPISLRMISAMQMKRSLRKGCQVFAVSLREFEDEDGEKKSFDHSVLQEFIDVFPDEIPGMPPKWDIDFRIDLIPGAEPISRAPYRTTT